MNIPAQDKLFSPVLHIDTGRTWGGGQQQVFYLHRGLLDKGIRSILLCRKASPLARKAAAESVPAVEMEMKPGFGRLTAARIAKLARLHRVRTIHMHTSYAHSLGLRAARLLESGVHKVVSRRVAFTRKPSFFVRRKYLGRQIRYIAISNAVREKLVRLGVPENDISVVYSGIDLGRFSRFDAEMAKQIAEKLGIAPGSFLVGSVGSLVPCKGHTVLIEAISHAARTIPNLVCLIVGEGPHRARLEGLIRRRGLEEIVILTGQRGEVPELLSLMDLFVMPSLDEGLGLALLEAMAAGKPVVASDVGGIPEVVSDSETGLLVPAAQPRALAEALIALSRDPARMSALAESGKRRVRERFSYQSMVEGTLTVYRSLS
jgi:glycosyltransferase involved in cell wall biosynthesis